VKGIVQVRQASKWYGPVIGVNEVTLDLAPGITGLLGPNGAGKSTLMKLIVGLLRPSLGEVLVEGQPVWGRPGARREIGFSPEVDGFFQEMSVRKFVQALARLSGLPHREASSRADAALEMVGMSTLGHKTLRSCSKGMRQRTKIAQALVHDPRILILDEPLSGIDPVGRSDLMALFRDLESSGKTVLISTHILHEIQAITDQVVLMARGRILASGAVGQIRGLLDEHPLTVRITTSGARKLASALVLLEEVAGVSLEDGGGGLVVKVRGPDRFFRQLPALLLGQEEVVERIEPLDESAEAIFDYLVGGGGVAP
jgi:ABC-2 type transport system ATP-binding protein